MVKKQRLSGVLFLRSCPEREGVHPDAWYGPAVKEGAVLHIGYHYEGSLTLVFYVRRSFMGEVTRGHTFQSIMGGSFTHVLLAITGLIEHVI